MPRRPPPAASRRVHRGNVVALRRGVRVAARHRALSRGNLRAAGGRWRRGADTGLPRRGAVRQDHAGRQVGSE